jgi:uncharacterized membrane protein YeiH
MEESKMNTEEQTVLVLGFVFFGLLIICFGGLFSDIVEDKEIHIFKKIFVGICLFSCIILEILTLVKLRG